VKPARHKRDTGQCIPQLRAGHKGVMRGGEKGCNNTMIDDDGLGSACFGRG